MNIKETFLKLTSKTYPHGIEDQLESFLPKGYFKDKWGNYFYKIGNPQTAFTCHLDCATKEESNVNHIIDGDIIRTDGTTILGADDKAGMTIILWMIHNNVPGLYCFFIGEEVGCVGSSKSKGDDWSSIKKMISFDRRGLRSVITHQSGMRTCSDEFAKDLSNQLNLFGMSMFPDSTGVWTDSGEFYDVIDECTNISVGYYKEHTKEEHQDISHLEKLCQASVLVNWESLVVKRDKNKKVDWELDYYSYPSSRRSHKIWPSTREKLNYSDIAKKYYSKNSESINVKTHKNWKGGGFNKIREKSNSEIYYDDLSKIILNQNYTKDEFYKMRDIYIDRDNPHDVKFFEDTIKKLRDY